MLVTLSGVTLEHQSKFAGRYKKKDWLYNGVVQWSKHEIEQDSAGIWYDGSQWIISELESKGTSNVHIKGAEFIPTCPDSGDIEWYYQDNGDNDVATEIEVQLEDTEGEIFIFFILKMDLPYPKI